MADKEQNATVEILTRHPVLIGLVVRLWVAWFLPWLLDDGRFLPGVAYTDIDFHVFSDGAAHIQRGESPYDRTTYRYTPFLAALLARLPHREAGRVLFCVADTYCGWIICLLRRIPRARARAASRRQSAQNPVNENTTTRKHSEASTTTFFNLSISPELEDALWWLYNPLAINICTRGSSESLVVLLPVLTTVWTIFVYSSNKSKASLLSSLLVAITAGVWHGMAIHAKLYPIIYTLSFMTALMPPAKTKSDSSTARSLLHALLSLIRRLLTPAPLVFGATAVATFVGLTYKAVQSYGDVALQEGLLYHFSRVDHRHNYSLHWYWIYLARDGGGGDDTIMPVVGRLLLVPQLILLLFSSLAVAPHNLPLALFVQTFLFVAHNKVITAQYFTWYLCLLPLCSSSLHLTRRVRLALVVLLASILVWLGTAYCLEMQGMAVHRLVWMASVLFFVANVNLLGALLASSSMATTEFNDNRVQAPKDKTN